MQPRKRSTGLIPGLWKMSLLYYRERGTAVLLFLVARVLYTVLHAQNADGYSN
jgi:hypothetical protein